MNARLIAAVLISFAISAPFALAQDAPAPTPAEAADTSKVKIHVDPETGDIEVEKVGAAPPAPVETKHAHDIDFAEEALGFFRRLSLDVLWLDNTWMQWALLATAIGVGFVGSRLVTFVLGRIGKRWIDHGWIARGTLFSDAVGPVNLLLLTIAAAIGLAQIRMSEPVRVFCGGAIGLLILWSIFWYLYNLVGVLEILLQHYVSRTSSPLDNQVLPLIRKSLRLLLLIVAALTILEVIFGADVGAALAGLGIAGLAVSLAAQDSLKNLFGSILILFDKPFQVGDRIVFQGYDGSVEEIGFRSTKVRTLAGNLVTVPNSAIANEAVENVARRPFLQRKLNVTVTYDTSPEKIEEGIQIIRDLLASDELRGPIFPADGKTNLPRVFFNDFNADSLNILVQYWYSPTDWWAFIEHSQKFNLELLKRFNAAGIEFAFPTQTLFLAGDPKRELALQVHAEEIPRHENNGG